MSNILNSHDREYISLVDDILQHPDQTKQSGRLEDEMRLKLVVGVGVLTCSACADVACDSISKATAPHTSASPTSILTAGATGFPRYCARASTTTDTIVSRQQFNDPTLVTIYITRTWTTLQQHDPAPASYPCTLTDTFISSATYEYQMTYSDGHSSTTIYSAAPITFPTTRVESQAPTASLSCSIV